MVDWYDNFLGWLYRLITGAPTHDTTDPIATDPVVPNTEISITQQRIATKKA